MTSDPSHLADLDRAHVWHPFTQMRAWSQEPPLIIDRAEGNYLIDAHGNRYLDGVASLWVNVHGHGRREIIDAIAAQASRVCHSTLLGLANVPSIELAARLAALAPGDLDKVFYSDAGSTAVEIALKIAFQYWQHRGRPQKHRFVHLDGSYHGDTLGAVGVGGISLFHEVYGPLLVPGLRAPSPHPYRHPRAETPAAVRDEALAGLARILDAHASEVAAVIVEPLVQGAAGMLVHPPGYLRGVADLCREHEALLIADEVATGFGRTGTMFACEQEAVVPDLLCVAKGITGGTLPLAATIARPAIFEAFLGEASDRRTFYHGHTYTGNPVACAAALASLDLFDKDQVLVGLGPKIAHLRDLLETHARPLSHVGDVRQRGMMVGIELVADGGTAEAYPATDLVGARVCRAARDRGIIIRPLGDVIVLMPPLAITDGELDDLVAGTCAAIAQVTA